MSSNGASANTGMNGENVSLPEPHSPVSTPPMLLNGYNLYRATLQNKICPQSIKSGSFMENTSFSSRIKRLIKKKGRSFAPSKSGEKT